MYFEYISSISSSLWNYFLTNQLIICSLLLIIYEIIIYLINNRNDCEENEYEISLKILRDHRIGTNCDESQVSFPNGWIPIMESRELAVNEIKPFIAFGQELVAFRGESGEAHVCDAFCPHLGANLGYGGEMVYDCGHECIKCPFHDWKFRVSDGVCNSIPDIEDSDKLLSRARLKLWNVLEQNYQLFVWYHSRGEKPDWFPDRIDAEMIYFGKFEKNISNNLQDISENGADISHFNTLHKPFTPENNNGLLDKLIWSHFYNKFIIDFIIQENNDRHKAIHTSQHITVGFGYELFKTDIINRFIGPAYQLVTFESFFGSKAYLTYRLTPIGNNLLKLSFSVYSGTSILSRILGLILKISSNEQLMRDVVIWNNKKYLSKPQLCKNDKRIAEFRRWYKQFY